MRWIAIIISILMLVSNGTKSTSQNVAESEPIATIDLTDPPGYAIYQIKLGRKLASNTMILG